MPGVQTLTIVCSLFYSQIWKETEYQIDDEAVSAYLPFNVTYAGILKVREDGKILFNHASVQCASFPFCFNRS